jgi:predicted transcriptional regulator
MSVFGVVRRAVGEGSGQVLHPLGAPARDRHKLRTAAGLTQATLAKLIGTTASVVCRLEDADYEGHSQGMLRRIGAALNQRVEIRFVPIRRPA